MVMLSSATAQANDPNSLKLNRGSLSLVVDRFSLSRARDRADMADAQRFT
jgi:hypothetical protein